ncbi:MAG TPA: malto-oligosyltrehalose trehalohydrolase [Mycobacteriales bacterium]|nr:malto-oligosyltrehalose trehalohydrolase [Mycobacteriales bacterium]
MASFAVWAPAADQVRLWLLQPAGHQQPSLGTEHAMQPAGNGWWRAEVGGAAAGTDYGFLIDDDTPLPDPRSRWQPDTVHGLSRCYDHHNYAWRDAGWTGRQLPGSVIYELHVGTFTPKGTFSSAAERLDHLVNLGIDLVELLPVNAVNGTHNWGYDGVGWYAVHEPYGGPDGLKQFVDAAHQRGVGVILDVVYNHLGPSGNYLPRFGPYLKPGRNTWGDLVNLDGPGSDEVRRYIIDNALMWLSDYHIDGLRLDAVHALVDHRATHLLEELVAEVDALSTHLGRPLSLIAESDLNDPRLVTAREAGGYGLHAQWNDDVHHAVHVLLTGETQGYYADFAAPDAIAKTFTGAFFHDGTWSRFRERSHGRPVDRRRLPGHRFVVFLQDHDQIGNRALGDRLSVTLSPGQLKIGATLILTSPYTPMLFMGEEWAAGTPWQFFTSHPEPGLAAAVGQGRREEFAAHGWPADDVPDPQDPETFARSKLDWAELDDDRHAEILDYYRRLIALRHALPELSDPRLDRVDVRRGELAGHPYLVIRRGRYTVACNLAGERRRIPLDGAPLTVMLASERGFVFRDGEIELPAESVAVIDLGTRDPDTHG